MSPGQEEYVDVAIVGAGAADSCVIWQKNLEGHPIQMVFDKRKKLVRFSKLVVVAVM